MTAAPIECRTRDLVADGTAQAPAFEHQLRSLFAGGSLLKRHST